MAKPTQVAKAHVVALTTSRADDGGSKQKDTAVDLTGGLGEEQVISPPLDPDQLAKLSEINGTRGAIIDAIARNSVGLGYSVELRPEHEDEKSKDDVKKDIKRATAALERVSKRDTRRNNPSFTDALYSVKVDEEETIMGALEIARNRITGKISGIYHVPGKKVRRLANREGWVLLSPDGDPSKATTFRNFGDRAEYDDDGNVTGLKRGITENELLVFQRYTSESRDYGLPRDHALTNEYLGDSLAAKSNTSFFDSSGTPPTIIFVEGVEKDDGSQVIFEVPHETLERIGETIKADGGHQKRVAVIPVPPGASVKDVKLGTVSDKDIGFTTFRKDIRRRQLGTFRMAPIFLADNEDSGRYTAEVERALTLEQVFDPEQTRYEERLSETILADLGFPHLMLKFKRLAVEGDAARREAAEAGADFGVVTNREFRKAHGFSPLPEAEKAETEIEWDGKMWKSAPPEPGQVPFGWNDALIVVKKGGGSDRIMDPRPGEPDNRGLQPGIGGRTRATRRRKRGTPSSAAQSASGNLRDKLAEMSSGAGRAAKG